MDLALSEEQEMLKTMAREFLVKECPKTLVRAMEEDDKGYPPELWTKMAQLGWMGLMIPEAYGGTGSTFLDECVLLEEMGRALVPGPYFSTVILGALPILLAGTEEQKRKYLPSIARGQLIMTLALTDASAKWTADGVDLRATPSENGGYTLKGTKLFVTDANVADYMVVVARTGNARNPEGRISLFIVEAKSPGVAITQLKTIASDKQCEVVFDNVQVPAENLLGEKNKGWGTIKKLSQMAAVARCALSVGGGQQVMEMTVAYAKDRVQFGRPIGSFQAVQHHCANMLMDLEGCRYITYQAAWKIAENMDFAQDAAMAKGWVSEAYRRVVATAHQVHGGIGFTKDHDLQLYFRRAKAWELSFGDADFHRELVAQGMGL